MCDKKPARSINNKVITSPTCRAHPLFQPTPLLSFVAASHCVEILVEGAEYLTDADDADAATMVKLPWDMLASCRTRFDMEMIGKNNIGSKHKATINEWGSLGSDMTA